MNLISRITVCFFRFAFWFFVCLLLSFCFAILFNIPRKVSHLGSPMDIHAQFAGYR